MLTTSSDERTVLSSRHFNAQDDTVPEGSGNLLQFFLELGDDLGVSTEADLVRWLTRSGAEEWRY